MDTSNPDRTTRHLIAVAALVLVCLSTPAQVNEANPPATGRTITVDDAYGNGIKDARAAIQHAIDAAAASGGGTVYFHKGTYLLNSYRPSTHPWKFYNLRVPSNVTLDAESGAILLQGPAGRAPLPVRADHVENNVVAVGTANYQAVTFQDPARNGGFLPANPTSANSSTVTLSNPADTSRFAAGDLIAICGATSGDVIESEPTEVTSANRATGVLALAHPLARAFPRAFVANVTKLATTHVSLRNLTIQGAIPLAATEVFGLSLFNCRLIYDPAGGGSNSVTGMEVNTIRGFRMENGSIEPAGSAYAGLELPQRNSQDVVFENVTFKVASAVFGEYATHWKLLGNQFWIYPNPSVTAGIATGGLDVVLEKNAIHGENLTAGGGSGALLSDGIGPADYIAYLGEIRYQNNTVDCRADGNNCLRLTTRDPVVDGNRIDATGSTTAIKIEGSAKEFKVTNNIISAGALPALILNVPDLSAAIVKGNVFRGTGPFAIILGGRPSPADGERLSAGNTISGFAKPFRVL